MFYYWDKKNRRPVMSNREILEKHFKRISSFIYSIVTL